MSHPATVAFLTYPASAQEEYPLAQEFRHMGSYEQEHRNAPLQTSSASPFPYSVPDEPSFADEGLIPGVAGMPPYDNRAAVGATR